MDTPHPGSRSKRSTAVQFLLRGLAISLPAILTIAIVVWLVGLVNRYIIVPTSFTVRYTIALMIDESRATDQLVRVDDWLPALDFCGRDYAIAPAVEAELKKRVDQARGQNRLPDELIEIKQDALPQSAYVPFGKQAVPYLHFAPVARHLRPDDRPSTSTGVYMELVTIRYIGSQLALVVIVVCVVVVLLYFLGRLVTARLGAWLVTSLETKVLGRLPLISQVYSSVKQVTDFVFSERAVEYNRVVAVEYPRRGMWSIGFVTGDSFLEITAAAGEPLVSVLMPTSPMPMTGFTINVPRSEVVDLNITVDQAFQFCLSCGVLIPAQQKVTPELLQAELARRLTGTGPVPPVSGDRAPSSVAPTPRSTTPSPPTKPTSESD